MRVLFAALLIFSLGVSAAPISEPGFALEHLSDGKPFRFDLGDAKAFKATVVVFLSSECPCSESHEPVLKKLSADYPQMRFLGVVANADEDLQQAKAHFAAASLPFPILYDRGQKLADKLKAFKTPHAFVLSDDLEQPLFRGGVDNSHEAPSATQHHLRNALAEIQIGKKPETREARVLGCAISR